MNYLEESLKTLHQENVSEKREILSYLDEITQAQDEISDTCVDTFKNNFMMELCKYQQQIHHKLMEIKFELKKFVALNKPPVFKPMVLKKCTDEDPIDINILKANSMKLITKLEEYSVRDRSCSQASLSEEITVKSEEVDNSCNPVQYPYISNDTLEKLSDHTKDMLKDLLTETNSSKIQAVSSIENIIPRIRSLEEINVNCGHFPEIVTNYPAISKSCDKSFIEGPSFEQNLDICGHFPLIEEKWPEIIEICPKHSHRISESSDSTIKDDAKPQHSKTVDLLDCKLQDLNRYEEIDCSIKHEVEPQNLINLENKIEDTLRCEKQDLKSSEFGNFELIPEFTSSLDIKSAPIMMNEDLLAIDIFRENCSTDVQNCEKECSVSEVFENSIKEPQNDAVLNDPTVKLNNHWSKTEEDSSITESETDKISENDKGYSVGSDTDQGSIKSKKRKKQKFHKLDSTKTNFGTNQNLKNIPIFQNDLGEDVNSSETGSTNEQEPSPSKENLKDCNLNANVNKVIFSAQQKIMKLGLEDRGRKFEESRKVAPLPDLRLQPSVSDNEKMKQLQNQGNKFEIRDRNMPSMYAKCVFSHIESPFEFYIHLDDEESKLLDSLNDLITQQFRRTKTVYVSKFEAFQKIGKFCCAYVKNDKSYYRAEVVDWLFEAETETKLVIVQLVDYGNRTYVHYKHLRELTKEFCLIPKIAIKCYLPMLYPPGSTKSDLLTEWPLTTIEALMELSGLYRYENVTLFKIFYVHKEGDILGVDMYEIGDSELTTIGQLLIDLGHAVQIVLPKDDPMGMIKDDEDIKRMEECENINEVVLGYDPKDEWRICKFTLKDGTCFKGKNCKLEHIPLARGGYTTDQTLAFAGSFNELKLPDEAEYVRFRFTLFIGASHYYINLMKFAESLARLEEIMNDKRNISKFQIYNIMPAYGEIVLVKHWTKRWLRAKVRHHSYDDVGNCIGVQLFMVDYGDVIDAPLSNIRQIQPEYLDLPFQAVECILYNYKARNLVDIQGMDTFFYENMVYRQFVAQVMGVSDMTLCLKIFHKDRDLGAILTEQGFLTEINAHVFPSKNTIVVPG